MFRVFTRILVPRALSRTAPGLIALLFGVSQASAVVDFRGLAIALQARGWPDRAGLAAALVGIGTLSIGRMVRPVLYTPHVAALWRLPITDAQVAAVFATAALVATTPVAIVAALLGPGALVGLWACAAAAVLGFAARSRWTLVPLALAPLLAGPWGPVGIGVIIPLLPRLGRAMRDGRPVGDPPTRTWWLRGGPVTALVERDLLAVLRTHGLRPWVVGGLSFLAAAFVQSQLHRTWAPSAIDTGALWIVGAHGLGCSAMLGEVARATGSHQLHRVLPVSPVQRACAVWLTAAIALVPATLAVLLMGTGTALGGVRVVALASVFPSLATRALIVRPIHVRPDLVSHGVTATVFVTFAAVVHPLGLWAAVLVGGAAFLDSVRRLA